MVDKGLEEIQEKNNVGQKLHNSTAFHGWVDKNTAWSTDIQKLQTAEGYPLLLKPPYGIIDSEADENKNADCFSAIGKS